MQISRIGIPVCISVVLFIYSCAPEKTHESDVDPIDGQELVKYAQGFRIEQHQDYTELVVNGAWRGEDAPKKYILYKDVAPKGFEGYTKIKVPIKSIACMSLTHLAFLDKIGRIDALVGVSGGEYSSNKELLKGMQQGEIVELGNAQSINYEQLVEASPDIVMTYGIDQSSSKHIAKMQELGLTTVLNAEYMEVHPLGKAEWIKYVALFFDEAERAAKVFDEIEAHYLALTTATDTVSFKPTVFVGMPWKGSWYVAGGKSFQAKLFEDAGANYIWKQNDEQSSLVKSKELVLSDAFEAEYWLNVNSYTSLTDIQAQDELLTNLRAFKTQKIYNNDKRLNEHNGNDYWESGVVEPHIILKDLIQIFHPNLLNHELKYYRRLE